MPNISTAELSRLKTIESRAADSREYAIAEQFTQEFIENVGIMLAMMPRADWPVWVNTAFNHASGKFPHGARIYSKLHTAK